MDKNIERMLYYDILDCRYSIVKQNGNIYIVLRDEKMFDWDNRRIKEIYHKACNDAFNMSEIQRKSLIDLGIDN